MGLKGDLDSISLADIFQTLSMTGQEGTLVVRNGELVKHIYFTRDGVSLLTSGEKKMGRLGDLLVGMGKLTPVQLQSALAEQRASGALLGEVLIRSGQVTQKDIDQAVRSQIEEEIYDLFAWDSAQFEFNEGAAPENFFPDHDRAVTRLTFHVNALIMEAARRADEWEQIEQHIPSTKDIFRLEAAARAGEYTDQEQVILDAVDGERSVDEVVTASHVARFDACRFLARLAEEGKARRAPIEHLIEKGDQRRAVNDLAGAFKFYDRARATKAKKRSDLLDARRRCAEILEALGRKKEAGEEYKSLADLRLEEKDLEGAINYWQKVIDLNPLDLENKERLVSVYLENRGNLDPDRSDVIRSIEYSLFKNGKALAMAFSYAGQLDKAKGVLQKLIDMTPGNLELRKALVNIHLEHNEKAEAVSELEQMASQLVSTRNFDELSQAYQAILKVAPDRDDIKKKLALLQRPPEAGRPGASAAPRRRGRLGMAVVVLLLLSAAGGYGYYAFVHVPEASKSERTALEALVQRLLADRDAPFATVEADFRRVVSDFRALADRYPFSPLASDFRRRADSIEIEARQRQERSDTSRLDQATLARTRLDRIQAAAQRDPWDSGALLALIAEAVAPLAGNPQAAETRDALLALQQEIGTAVAAAGARLAAAQEFERAGQLQAAWEAFRALHADEGLRRRFPTIHEKILVPYEIRSDPPGASVTVGDAAPEGRTPLRRRGRMNDTVTFRVEHPGYEPLPAHHRVGVDRPVLELELRLTRLFPRALEMARPDTVSHPLLPIDGGVAAVTDDGKIHLLAVTAGGLERYGPIFSLGSEGDLDRSPAGGPAVAAELVLASRQRGGLVAFARASGEVRWQYRLQGGADEPAEEAVGAPLADEALGLAIVSGSAGRLHLIRLADGTRQAVLVVPGDGRRVACTPPARLEGHVVVATADGEMAGWRLPAATGDAPAFRAVVVDRAPGSGAKVLRHAPVAGQGLLLLATSEGERSQLLAFDLSRVGAAGGKAVPAWAPFPLGGEASGPPLVAPGVGSGAILVAVQPPRDPGRLVGIKLDTGDRLWRQKELTKGLEVGTPLWPPGVWKTRAYCVAGNQCTVVDLTTGAVKHVVPFDRGERASTAATVLPDGHVLVVTRDERFSRIYVLKE